MFRKKGLNPSEVKRVEFRSRVTEEIQDKRDRGLTTSQEALAYVTDTDDCVKDHKGTCPCFFCRREQRIFKEIHIDPDEITALDKENRRLLHSDVLKNPLDRDFCFIMNRLRNFKLEGFDMALPVADTIFFNQGVPKFVVCSVRSKEWPLLKYFVGTYRQISKTKVQRLIESKEKFEKSLAPPAQSTSSSSQLHNSLEKLLHTPSALTTTDSISRKLPKSYLIITKLDGSKSIMASEVFKTTYMQLPWSNNYWQSLQSIQIRKDSDTFWTSVYNISKQYSTYDIESINPYSKKLVMR